MKKLFAFSILVVFIAFAASAQSTQKQATPPGADSPQSAQHQQGDKSHDMESRIAKMHEERAKLEAKIPKMKDEQMKSDAQAMIAKMQQVDNDYNSTSGIVGMSPDQKKQTQQRLQKEMQELRQMHDDMTAKYGGQKGSGKKGQQQQMQNGDQPNAVPPQK